MNDEQSVRSGISRIWKSDIDLRSHTTFAVPVTARYFLALEQEDELPAALEEARDADLPVLILGGGSNILFTENFPGLVIKIDLNGISARADPNSDGHVLVTAAAGENWHALVEYCLQRGWYGLENLALIPGSAGAAPVQNIGAYGVELSDTLVSVRYFDRNSQQVTELSAEACQPGYRDSVFKHRLKDNAVILSVCLRLCKTAQPKTDYPSLQQALGHLTDPDALDVFNAVCNIRRSRLPDPARLGNAGSFFRNPVIRRELYQRLLERWPQLPGFNTDNPDSVKLPAAWLIEQAGWKGIRQGDAGVHEQQALVLVNYGNASGFQLLQLAKAIARDVQQKFGIDLEPEVNILPASAWHAV